MNHKECPQHALQITAQFLVVIFSILALPQPTRADVRVPPYERVQLPNGAVLLLMEQHEVPLISFRAVLRGGAVSDPAGRSGMSSLLAAMLEKGAGSRDAFAFANAIASVGGAVSTDSDTESLTVRGSFMARDQRLMIELLSDMLQRPLLQAGEF